MRAGGINGDVVVVPLILCSCRQVADLLLMPFERDTGWRLDRAPNCYEPAVWRKNLQEENKFEESVEVFDEKTILV